ncbi:MAG: homocysteine S-methyltransferase family protein [Hornefia butyriciproducens]|nr:homocysteine S-methyltransferase family protein [Hornefia butyriciproducens]
MNKIEKLFGNPDFIILDGGFGTMLQQSGAEVGKVPEVLNITRPEIVQDIHRKYIEAGADVIYTCSFGINDYKIEGCGYTVEELTSAAVKNAAEAAVGTDVKIALDIGPIGRLVEPNGNLTFEEAYEIFRRQIVAGKGTDLIVIETMTDLYEMRAALLAAKENSERPVICTMSFEQNRRTFTGTSIPSMALTLEGLGADAIGINCSLGPAEFLPLIQELSQWTELPIVAKPNAGLPDPKTGKYLVGATEFADYAEHLADCGVRLAGGCCGTDPDYIRQLKLRLSSAASNRSEVEIPPAVCTPESIVLLDRPRVIGERINPTGKKKLKAAIAEGNLDYVLDMALQEETEGAEILDVNAGVPGVNEKEVIVNIIKKLQGNVSAPLQIDSGNPEVLEAALRLYCGKAIVNSVNGEEKSMAAILPIVKKYGASVIALTLDEDGIPKTVEKRLEIARKIMNRALSLGIPKKDIYVDCLTLTVSAEQDNASNTLEAIRRVKSELGLKTVLGVSNISFGLPQRPLINQNFLQMALTCGLDLAIINPAAPGMVAAIDVYKLIMGIDRDARDFIDKYKDTEAVSAAPVPEKKTVSAVNQKEGTLSYFISNGLEGPCRELIEKELEIRDPLDIVNNELIPILDETGKRFETGKIFIPQLILAATTAQAAFEVIKKRLAAGGGQSVSKGKIIVATVKGDVHDIGKNIVKVILENYGYDIIDLGKDVDPKVIVDRVVRDHVHLVGLSALMTTTLGNMEETIRQIRQAAPGCKVMTGGAVVTKDYSESIGADYYVADAMASAAAAKDVLG